MSELSNEQNAFDSVEIDDKCIPGDSVVVEDENLKNKSLWDPAIDKVYIDGPCGSKKIAGVLLARFESVSHVTHFNK